MMRMVWITAFFAATSVAAAHAGDTERYRDPTLPADLPFSSVVAAGDTLYVSGHIGRVRGTTSLIEGGIEAETRQTLDNMAYSLSLAGASLDDVVKCTVFLADMADFAAMNAVYADVFGDVKPARSSLGVNSLAWGALVEIECIATRPEAR